MWPTPSNSAPLGKPTHFGLVGLLVGPFLLGAAATAAESATEGIYVVPQSHIDVAWFWRYDPETIEVCIPMTFGRAVENMDKFPEYRFAASQVPLYEGMRKHHRQLASRVEELIRKGRWEIVGGHWLEFEGTGPCGESVVRQCLYGKRYFKQVYGVDIRNAWQPDAWSHPWTLPQILEKCEIDYYVFHRGMRGEYTFWWESADGSRVLAYRPFWGDFKRAIEHHEKIRQRYGVDISMWRAGGGDHGGGLTEDAIRKLKKQMAASRVPMRFSRVDAFLDALVKKKKDWPVLRDELGFELEGCHANAGRIKAANRRCENLLIEAEKFASVASRVAGMTYPKTGLKSAWLDVLMNQFHDTISGCVIPAGIEDAMKLYGRAEHVARQCRDRALELICRRIDTRGDGTPVVVFNSLSWPRTGPVEVELTSAQKIEHVRLIEAGGKVVPCQIVSTEKQGAKWAARCVFIARDVPAVGYKTYWASGAESSPAGPTRSSLRVGPWTIENDRFIVEFDSTTGDLVRIFDKQRATEVLPKGARANQVQIIEETGDSEGRLRWGKKTWILDRLSSINGWKVVETGPVRATVRIRNKLGEFLVAFDRFVTLYADVPWIDFRTHIEWNSTGKMVKIAFPTPYRKAKPTYDIPYGTIAREATGEERPALRWVDLGDRSGGVSLLNDCRYGHDVRNGVIRLDAIRSPVWPATNPDCGNQIVTYALYPHAGDWRRGRVMQRAYEFNNPLIAVVADQHEGRMPSAGSFVGINRPNVILSVIKQAEDGEGLVLRAYEIFGEKCSAKLDLTGMAVKKATLVNMLEKPLSSLDARRLDEGTVRVTLPLGAYEIATVVLE